MSIEELHNKAVELSEIAFMHKFKGSNDLAIPLFQEAFNYEKQAALLAREHQSGEPTISILLKSAAYLALNFGETREAEKLISLALYGDPPTEIAEELRNLLEDVYFQRHLNLNGIELGHSELQLVVAGNGVGFGMGKSEDIFYRVNTFSRLTYRTAERMLGKPFRETGDFPKEIKHNFQPYISTPRAASLAFTIRLGAPQQKLFFSDTETPETIINDIIENIILINQGKEKELKTKITDNAYFRNFLLLSKELAPDGDDVNLVGITIKQNGKEKQIEFRRKRSDFLYFTNEFILKKEKNKSNTIEITGRLSGADSEEGKIKIISSDDTKHSIIVPEGLGDIVKSYWDEIVQIKGIKMKHNTIKLIDLDPVK